MITDDGPFAFGAILLYGSDLKHAVKTIHERILSKYGTRSRTGRVGSGVLGDLFQLRSLGSSRSAQVLFALFAGYASFANSFVLRLGLPMPVAQYIDHRSK